MRKEGSEIIDTPEFVTLGLIVNEFQAAIDRHPQLANDLRAVIWGGSRGLDENRLLGNQTSDLDITTLLSPHRADDPANLECLKVINRVFRESSEKLMTGGIIPVVVATVRLEEAEIALAEMLHPRKKIIPVHWLFHPSPEFGLVNEPPSLLRDLVQGEILLGDRQICQEIGRRCRAGDFPRDQAALLGGLDWLTDTFRLFEPNLAGQLPRSYLLRQATHNLEYFLKWRVLATTIEKRTGAEPKTWRQIAKFQDLFPEEIWQVCQQAKIQREKGAWADEEATQHLFENTFRMWPDMVAVREGEK